MPLANAPAVTITVKQAEPLLAGDLAALTDEQVIQCYDAYASYISYLHADDYGDDWKKAPQYYPGLDKARAEAGRRGLTLPTGYLL